MPAINFSGLASGIDSSAIIDATIEAKRISAIPLENKIAINEEEDESLDKLREMLQTLDDAVKGFQTFRGNAVSKNISSSDEDSVGAVVSGGAQPGSVSFTVQQLAQTSRLTFTDTFAADTEVISAAGGTLTITVGSGSGAETRDINVTPGMTVNELLTTINEGSGDRYFASLVNVGTESVPEYRMMINTTETGVERGSLSISTGAGLAGEGRFQTFDSVDATDSIVDVSGVGTITRSKNTVSDIFPGISFELKRQSAAPVTLTVTNDLTASSKRVAEFVDAYNALKEYVDEEGKISTTTGEDGSSNSYGSLARTRVDDQIINSLRTAFLAVNGSDSDGNKVILADLGVKTDRLTGQLEFDSAIFEEKLGSDPEGVSSTLESLGDSLSSANGVIASFTSFNGVISNAKDSNADESRIISDRLARLESNLERQREYLVKLFARLEETVGEMQSGASALASLAQQGGS